MITLVDTSALAKLMVEEAESAALQSYLRSRASSDTFVVSVVGLTELRRLAIRLDVPPADPLAVADRFEVVAVTESMLHLAGTFPHRHLGTLDAIHVATAVVVGARTLVTYDTRQAEAAAQEGLVVVAPAA